MTDKTSAYNCDCLKAMSAFDDGFFDLAICDPPYNIGESGQTNKSRSCLAKSKDYGNKDWDDGRFDYLEYLQELFRVSKNQIIWGANNFQMPPSTGWIVWDKMNGENDFADCELAYSSFNVAVRKFSFRWQGMLQGNMKDKEERIHPTQKPVALYKWLLKNYAKEGDKILDTHGGSFSSRIAAFDMGFEYVGYELDTDYFNAAEKRFQQHKSQLKLFV